MYTKIIKNTIFVYIVYTKIAQTKISLWYWLHKKCTSISYKQTKNIQTVQNLYKMQTEKSLKLEMYVFLYVQTMYKLYKAYTTR